MSAPAGARASRFALFGFARRIVGRDLSLALSGQLLERAFSTLATLLMLAVLSKSDLGVWGACTAAFAIAVKLTDLGLDTGLLRTLARARREQDARAEREGVQGVYLAKVALATATFAAGWLLAPWLADHALDHPHVVMQLRVALAAIYGKQLVNFYRVLFVGRRMFAENSVFLASSPAVFLGAIGVAHLLGGMTLNFCLSAFALAPLAVSTAATLRHGQAYMEAFDSRRVWKRLRSNWTFSRWIYLTDLLATIRAQIGSLLIFPLLGSTSTGLYWTGDKVASLISIFANALLTVVAPRAAEARTRDEQARLLRRTHRWSLLLVAGGVPATWALTELARPVVASLKPESLPSIDVFFVLFVSMLFSVAALPCHAVITMSRPAISTAIEAVAATLAVGLALALVGPFGIMGVAWAMFVQRAVSAAANVAWVYWRVHRAPAKVE